MVLRAGDKMAGLPTIFRAASSMRNCASVFFPSAIVARVEAGLGGPRHPWVSQ